MNNNQTDLDVTIALVQQWTDEIYEGPGAVVGKVVGSDDICLAKLAAQYGADQELEACIAWFDRHIPGYELVADRLRSARRPEPPSLKEQALEAMREMQIEPCIINGVDTNAAVRAKYEIIRRALEQLPEGA